MKNEVVNIKCCNKNNIILFEWLFQTLSHACTCFFFVWIFLFVVRCWRFKESIWFNDIICFFNGTLQHSLTIRNKSWQLRDFASSRWVYDNFHPFWNFNQWQPQGFPPKELIQLIVVSFRFHTFYKVNTLKRGREQNKTPALFQHEMRA